MKGTGRGAGEDARAQDARSSSSSSSRRSKSEGAHTELRSGMDSRETRQDS